MKNIFFSLLMSLFLQGYSQVQSGKPLRRFMQSGQSSLTAIPYGNNPKTGHYVNASDAKIYYEVYGKGSPIVVLHGGIFGSQQEMGEFIDSLSKSYQVIAVSTRGHGKSEIGSAPLTYEQKANDVYAVIQAVTKDSVTVLGFSDGGYTGYKLASMYPARVKKLIVIGAGELYPGMRKFSFSLKDAFSYDSTFMKQQLAIMPEPQKLQQWYTEMENFYNGLTVGEELLQSIKCPVLVMAGERDQNAPQPSVLSAYQMLPNKQLSIVPNASHGVFLENFPAVWTSMLPFLRQ
jgi:pimeloyl-ACP methyl ester carboxylesterase